MIGPDEFNAMNPPQSSTVLFVPRVIVVELLIVAVNDHCNVGALASVKSKQRFAGRATDLFWIKEITCPVNRLLPENVIDILAHS